MLKWKRKRIRVGSTPLGRGVFSVGSIKSGKIIGEIAGTVRSESDPTSSEYAMDLGSGMTLDPAPPFRFLNHSCEPNCELITWEDEEEAKPGIPPHLLLRALRDIDPEEQLWIDYAWPAEMAIPCACQSRNCRGWIVDVDQLAHVVGARRHSNS